MTAALKPCPFCGGEAVVTGGARFTTARCRPCDAFGPLCDSVDAAVDAWNRRVVDPALAAAEARAEKAEAALKDALAIIGEPCPCPGKSCEDQRAVHAVLTAALAPTTTEGGAK